MHPIASHLFKPYCQVCRYINCAERTHTQCKAYSHIRFSCNPRGCALLALSALSRGPPNISVSALTYPHPFHRGHSCETGQKMSSLLLIWKVHYLVHKSQPLVPALKQMNPIHTPTTCFVKIQCNTVLSLHPLGHTNTRILRPVQF